LLWEEDGAQYVMEAVGESRPDERPTAAAEGRAAWGMPVRWW